MVKKIAVVAIVNYNGMILVGKKRDDVRGFLKGKWHIPGETLNKGENDEQGLIRGIKEEAGIEVRVLRYIAEHQTPTHTLVRWYECRPLSYDIKKGSDLCEVKWVPREEVANICDKKARELWPKDVCDYFT